MPSSVPLSSLHCKCNAHPLAYLLNDLCATKATLRFLANSGRFNLLYCLASPTSLALRLLPSAFPLPSASHFLRIPFTSSQPFSPDSNEQHLFFGPPLASSLRVVSSVYRGSIAHYDLKQDLSI